MYWWDYPQEYYDRSHDYQDYKYKNLIFNKFLLLSFYNLFGFVYLLMLKLSIEATIKNNDINIDYIYVIKPYIFRIILIILLVIVLIFLVCHTFYIKILLFFYDIQYFILFGLLHCFKIESDIHCFWLSFICCFMFIVFRCLYLGHDKSLSRHRLGNI